MPDITISVGTEVYVSANVPATYDTAGYEALAWTEIGEVGSIPEFGGTATVTEFIPIKTGVVNKKKGSINYGDITIPLAQVLSDVGQIALQSGFDGANKNEAHSVKLVNSEFGTIYFTAEVSGFTYNYGDANAITQNSASFAIKTKPVVDTDIVTVTYAAGANGAVYGDLVQTIPSGEDTTAVFAAPTNPVTHEFFEWSEDSSTDNPRTDTSVASDATFTATFAAL
jgi:hypothetical protein